MSLQPETDVSPADWLTHQIRGFAENVGSIVPNGFDTYARLFHPASRRDVPVTWTEIAGARGKVVHPEMQWANITGVELYEGILDPGIWDLEPKIGTMPQAWAPQLIGALENHTTTPERVWFCVWNGFAGVFTGSTEPLVELPNREYFLLKGPISVASESLGETPFPQSANLWWPDDRSWCVATEIDFAWTYVAGSATCVREVLDIESIEGLETSIDHNVDALADTVNPRPASG